MELALLGAVDQLAAHCTYEGKLSDEKTDATSSVDSAAKKNEKNRTLLEAAHDAGGEGDGDLVHLGGWDLLSWLLDRDGHVSTEGEVDKGDEK